MVRGEGTNAGGAVGAASGEAENSRVARMQIRLFGSISVEGPGGPLGVRDFGGVKPKQILEILVAARGHPVPKDRLAHLLWNERLPRNVSGALETYISVLRRKLAPDGREGHQLVVTAPEAYRFAVEHADIDLDRFDDLVDRSRQAPRGVARRYLELALELARGDVLEDEPYAEWAESLREQYRERVVQATLDCARAALQGRDYEAALEHAEAACSTDRFNEAAHRLAMVAYYALGRQRDALDVFTRCRRLLDEELGVEPTQETRDLHVAVLRQADLAVLLPPEAYPDTQLRFDGNSSDIPLIGRAQELAELEDAVERSLAGSWSLVLVEGEAELGKSRLLDEMAARLPSVFVGRARCYDLERDIPYSPLAGCLRGAVSEPDLARLPALRAVLPELAISDPTEPSTGVVLESLVELVRLSAPLVLLLDDLEHADVATIAALAYLQRRCPDAPVCVIATFRPDGTDPAHPINQLEPSLHLRLEELSRAELVDAGLEGLFESTGGHPGLVASTMTHGPVAELPATLLERLLSPFRIGGQFGYRLLATASVFDEPFEPEALAAMLGAEVAVVAEELERLSERRILQVEGFGFAFRFGATREALRQLLSAPRRHALEQRAGAA